jgi:hypothetical protein
MSITDWILASVVVTLWNGYLVYQMKKDKNL